MFLREIDPFEVSERWQMSWVPQGLAAFAHQTIRPGFIRGRTFHWSKAADRPLPSDTLEARTPDAVIGEGLACHAEKRRRTDSISSHGFIWLLRPKAALRSYRSMLARRFVNR